MARFLPLISLRFALVILSLLFCGVASAAFPPTTYWRASYSDPWNSSHEAACATQNSDKYEYRAFSQNACQIYKNGVLFNTITIQRMKNSCPDNSKLISGVCSCNAGYIEEGNHCVAEPEEDPCEMLADMCSGSQGKTSAFSLSGKKTGVSFTCMSPLSFGGDPLPGCTKGCMAQVGAFTTAYQDNSGAWVTTGTGVVA